MFVEPEKVPAFPKGREDNTHLNVYGARTIAGLTVDAIAQEIPELAKYVRYYDYVVAQDGTGDFFTVQEADVYKRQPEYCIIFADVSFYSLFMQFINTYLLNKPLSLQYVFFIEI